MSDIKFADGSLVSASGSCAPYFFFSAGFCHFNELQFLFGFSLVKVKVILFDLIEIEHFSTAILSNKGAILNLRFLPLKSLILRSIEWDSNSH